MNCPMGDRSVRIAQAVWLVLALAVTVSGAVAISTQWKKLQTTCHSDSNCQAFQLNISSARWLSEHGIPLGTYAGYTIAVLALVWVIWFGLAALIIWRRPQDRGARLTAFFLVLSSVWIVSTFIPGAANVGGSVSIALLVLFVLLFPDGHFEPRWTRWLAVAGVASTISVAVPAPSWTTIPSLLSPFAVIAVQIYRFRRISTWSQRQQTKWAVFGIAVVILGYVALAVPFIVSPSITGYGSLYDGFVNVTGTAIVLSMLPVFLGIAVLRSRLWDIDRIIGRALAYTSLSVTLVGIYLGSVIGLQALFRSITGQQSELAVAISTLIIAALFNPLRHRIQDVIARTFYRRKYDAAQVLAAFGATCRDETDLQKLTDNMMRVVEETVQPADLSLWLAGTARDGKP